MSSDRARVSYDLTRQYRSVVAQQGRVTLEADVNEAQEIAGEALRAQTADVIGPAGTPDDGYAISASGGAPDFRIGAGTMYVGGECVSLPADTTYLKQRDAEWLDTTSDPLWVEGGTDSEFIYLFLREQEVSAVEDTALREVALGGPDTAQRKRLIQRVARMPVKDTTCATALESARTAWASVGANFDSKTMMLTSPVTLQVGLANQPTAETP